MSNSNTGTTQGADSEIGRMGVASLASKRRLEASVIDYPNAPKQARKSSLFDLDPNDSIFSNGLEKCSSEFLTTSILARTLLTSSSPALTPCNNTLSSNPLESLKSTIEALPTPMFLESLEELQNTSPFLCSLPKVMRTNEKVDLEFLSSDTTMSTVTVLSPIDQDLVQNSASDWEATGISPMKTLVSMTHDQLITEDENGKSYFNLGPSEATILAKKSSSNKSSPSNSPPDQTWTSNSNSLDYLDESSSSSSCESISSEDLFNSCEEYDEASDDEEEVRSYKQERSTVLHLSLCKLNSFRNQTCAEPSLHRSVLICNTLRHIEQEIRHEDEVKKSETTFLQSRETLPPFWSAANPISTPNGGQLILPVLPPTVSALSIPTVATTLPTLCHDPYLSSSLYNNESPYTTVVSSPAAYDYASSHRPSQTPFHSPSYNYPETDLSTPHSAAQSSSLGFSSPSPVPSLLECDSGYAEDSNMSMTSYYYANTTSTTSLDSKATNSGDCYLSCTSDSTNYSCSLPILGDVTASLEITEVKIGEKDKSSNKSLEPGSRSRDSDSWAKFSNSSSTSSPPTSPTAAISSFAQQESQCGMESLKSDFFLGSTSGHSIHHQLPMDSLISPNYSSAT